MLLSSSLVVPIPEAATAIHGLRLRFDPGAAAGMPAHVTLLHPFVEPAAIDHAVLEKLRCAIWKNGAFRVVFETIESFPSGTVYLRPSPARPFAALTEQLVREFGIEPYAGLFDTITPHLTIGQRMSPQDATLVREEVMSLLPIEAVAAEVWLVAGSNETEWVRRASFELGPD